MRRLITTGNVSSQSWPSANTEVKIQAKSSTPSSAPTSATITFCPAGIALGDMLVAENRDSLSSIFVSKSELQYSYTAQSGEVQIANTGNLVLWPDGKVYYGNPNSANNEVATKGDLSGKQDVVSGLYFSGTDTQKQIYSDQTVAIGSDGNILLQASNVYYGVAAAGNEIAKKSDITTSLSALGVSKSDDNITITTDRTNTDAGISIFGTDFVEIGVYSGGEGVFLGGAPSNGLGNVYLGGNDTTVNKVATKGYVDSAIANVTNTVIATMTIVGNVNASTNKVFFKSDGPLSGYTDNAGRQTFSNPQESSNLTELVNSTNGQYIHIGYAFVVTTEGTIPTPDGNVSLSVGDIILFKNDYPNETINSTFKWYKI